MQKTSIATLALACAACSATPVSSPSTPAGASADDVHLVRAVFTETAGANLTKCEMTGTHIEVWPRSDQGAVLFVSGEHEGESCHPSLMITLDRPAAAGARYALGEAGVPLFMEEHCAPDGSVRSWSATGGELVFTAHPEGGLALQVVDATMAPSKARGSAHGRFKASLVGLRVGL